MQLEKYSQAEITAMLRVHYQKGVRVRPLPTMARSLTALVHHTLFAGGCRGRTGVAERKRTGHMHGYRCNQLRELCVELIFFVSKLIDWDLEVAHTT